MKLFSLVIIFFTLTPLLFSVNCPAEQSGITPIDNPGTRLLEQQKKIHRLKKGIASQREMVKDSREKEVSLLSELERTARRIREERSRLSDFKKDLENQEKLLRQKQEESAHALAEKKKFKVHVEKRLEAYYRVGPVGVMNVIFSTDTLPDLLTFQEYFRHIIQYDQQVINQFRSKIRELTEARTALEREKRQLIKVIASVKRQEARLAATRLDRLSLLKKVRTEKKLYRQALIELEEAATGLAEKLAALKREAEQARPESNRAERKLRSPKKRRPNSTEVTGFATLKGRLDPPVSGSVTTYFGRNTDGKFGITTFANGIDIKTKAGTSIKAIYDGRIVYSGFLRGYGNLLIIDHGQQYYSLISRAASLSKKKGDPVVRGEVIGTMSDQESLLSDGLHFAIRHGTQPENPLHWVNNAKLKIRARKSAKK